MTATIDGHIPDKDIAAKLECYGFVASAYAAAEHHSGLFGILARQSLAVYHAAPRDRDIVLPDGIDETILEVCMTTVLISRPLPYFRLIIVSLVGGGYDGGTGHDM